MAEERLIMLAILILGVLARNPLIVSSAAILLVVQALDLHLVYRHIQTRGIDLGLILLLLAVLVPFAAGRVGVAAIREAFTSVEGLAAVAGGILASAISAPGVALLQDRPEVIVGLVVGSILGVLLLRGIPVGPLAAAGFAAVLLRLIGKW
ncbi:MAG: DUF441 family protein [Bacillota bacterium]|nr:DUF441 domain-containing protein [Bacillota bacterium]PZN44443.1 MAG: DUF441 domain-containing protein [Bacillota bacterium]